MRNSAGRAATIAPLGGHLSMGSGVSLLRRMKLQCALKSVRRIDICLCRTLLLLLCLMFGEGCVFFDQKSLCGFKDECNLETNIVDVAFMDCRMSPIYFLGKHVRCRGRLRFEDGNPWLAPFQEDIPTNLFLSADVNLFFGPGFKKLLIELETRGETLLKDDACVLVDGYLEMKKPHLPITPPSVVIRGARVEEHEISEVKNCSCTHAYDAGRELPVFYKSSCRTEFWVVFKSCQGDEYQLIYCSNRIWNLHYRRILGTFEMHGIIGETMIDDPLLSQIGDIIFHRRCRPMPDLEEELCRAQPFTSLKPEIFLEKDAPRLGKLMQTLFRRLEVL